MKKFTTRVPKTSQSSDPGFSHQTPALYADIDGVLMPVTKSSEGEKYQVRPKLCKRIFIPSKSLGVPFCAPCNFHAFLGFMDSRCEEGINW